MRRMLITAAVLLLMAAQACAAGSLTVGEQTLIGDTMLGSGQLLCYAEVRNEADVPMTLDPQGSAVFLTDRNGKEIAVLPAPVLFPQVLLPGETGWLSLATWPELFEDGDRIAAVRIELSGMQVGTAPARVIAAGWMEPPLMSGDWMNLTDAVILPEGVTGPEGLLVAFGVYTPEGRLAFAWGGGMPLLDGEAEDGGQWKARVRLPDIVLNWCRARGTVPDLVQTIICWE